MRRSSFWVTLSVLLTAGIAFTANLFSPSPALKTLGVNLFQFDLLPTYNLEADSAAEVGLTAKFSTNVSAQNETLSYSSQAEVFRFSLQSNGPYTLRYLTLRVQSQGLKPSKVWTIYPIKDGSIDFKNPVAVNEKYQDGLLRFRFSSSASAAYLAEPGLNSFAVLTSVLKDPASGSTAQLSMDFPDQLSKEWNWAWLPGHHGEAWLQVDESLGVEEVELAY